ncbi:hypothetical protein ASD35_12900 [Pelomonas sp. Root1444]|nr:hypothetical protein ASD35_12900 [Pelomonas sp. Root1444]
MEPQWYRRRGVRKVHVVAVLAALLAVAVVLGMFNQFGASDGSVLKTERQLIASVDLRIANPAESFAKGEAEARKDVESDGPLKLFRLDAAKPPSKADTAKAERLKRRHGIVWVDRGKSTPQSSAYAAGYNHVVQAEIERRHGPEFLDRLLRGEEPADAP